MPFCHLTFLAVRPPETPQPRRHTPEGTLGHALRARRWQLGLDQGAAAKRLGVSKSTYQTWEWNTYVPGVPHIPAVIAFLGRDWRAPGETFGERLRYARTAAGLTMEQLAVVIGVDESTVWRWETNVSQPSVALQRRINARLDVLRS